MIIPYSPQNSVNFDPMKFKPLPMINLSGTPNIDRILSLRNLISSSESTFFNHYFWPFREIIYRSENVHIYLTRIQINWPDNIKFPLGEWLFNNYGL
jgi:hypothetical protein